MRSRRKNIRLHLDSEQSPKESSENDSHRVPSYSDRKRALKNIDEWRAYWGLAYEAMQENLTEPLPDAHMRTLQLYTAENPYEEARINRDLYLQYVMFYEFRTWYLRDELIKQMRILMDRLVFYACKELPAPKRMAAAIILEDYKVLYGALSDHLYPYSIPLILRTT